MANKIITFVQHIFHTINIVLKSYKYRVLLLSLLGFIMVIRAGPKSILPIGEESDGFKIFLGIIIFIAIIISQGKHTMRTKVHGFTCFILLAFSSSRFNNPLFEYFMSSVIILFFTRITLTIIKMLLHDKHIGTDLLVGCIAGYIMIAICGFLLFSSLDNFLNLKGFAITISQNSNHMFLIMYYSFITLMTIGYGDIVPVMPSMQLVSILYSLVGRSYSTFVLAMILKKFDNNTQQ